MRYPNFARGLAFVLAAAFAAAPPAAAKVAPTGKLRTSGNRPVAVNGNRVTSGTTVYSGAQIESPEKVGATIEMPSLGRLDIAPQTRLTLTFVEGSVEVALQSGYAVLTTEKGVVGRLKADGKVFETDPSKQSSVAGRTSGSAAPEKAGGSAGGASTRTVAVVAGAGAAAAGGAAAARRGRGRNLSPGNPRGNN